MWTAERVVARLRARGELRESVPGAVGLAGGALALMEAIEARVRAVCRDLAGEEWRPPPALGWGTLEDADYFASFPQWLTAAAHLGDDGRSLERVARADRPAEAARGALRPADAALPPAVCYHVFEGLRGVVLPAPRLITAQATCWRHEGAALRPLERGWAFTMREAVCLGDAAAVAEFRERGEAAALALAESLGLDAELVEATDPFFRPTARGKALLQQVKGLKRELMLPLGGGRRVAAASSNLHEAFFGRAFGISAGGGVAASSGCVAFGVERWLLAVLVAHGPEPADWPMEGALTAKEAAR